MPSNMKKLYLRPHHALCILLFDPNGHSTPYSEIMYELIDIVESNPQQEISLCTNLDMICKRCPHNENGTCEKADEVHESDNKTLAFCNLNINETLAWESLQRALTDSVIIADQLKEACKGCRYIPQCEMIIKNKFITG